jgi:hypothetical protein
MVDYRNVATPSGNVSIQLTAEEQAQLDIERADFASKSGERKLDIIRGLRSDRLKETDWMGFDDVTMPENIKTWRQSLRDLPQDNTTEEQYDLLLARVDGNLTNEIWSKP